MACRLIVSPRTRGYSSQHLLHHLRTCPCGGCPARRSPRRGLCRPYPPLVVSSGGILAPWRAAHTPHPCTPCPPVGRRLHGRNHCHCRTTCASWSIQRVRVMMLLWMDLEF